MPRLLTALLACAGLALAAALPAGAAHGASSVTAAGQRGDADLHATPAGTPLVAWTVQTGTTNAGYRVRTATP